MGAVRSSQVQGHEVVWEAAESENTLHADTGRQVQGVHIL